MDSWFPDTTVVRNFSAVRKVPLLEGVLDGAGRCAEAIDFELSQIETNSGQTQIREMRGRGSLGVPISIEDPDEVSVVHAIRRAELGGDPGDPLDSLGEAETLFLIRNREEFASARWLTDDVSAYHYGIAQRIVTLCTQDVMAIAVVRDLVSADEGFMLLGLMGTRNRVLAFAPTSQQHFDQLVDRIRTNPEVASATSDSARFEPPTHD